MKKLLLLFIILSTGSISFAQTEYTYIDASMCLETMEVDLAFSSPGATNQYWNGASRFGAMPNPSTVSDPSNPTVTILEPFSSGNHHPALILPNAIDPANEETFSLKIYAESAGTNGTGKGAVLVRFFNSSGTETANYRQFFFDKTGGVWQGVSGVINDIGTGIGPFDRVSIYPSFGTTEPVVADGLDPIYIDDFKISVDPNYSSSCDFYTYFDLDLCYMLPVEATSTYADGGVSYTANPVVADVHNPNVIQVGSDAVPLVINEQVVFELPTSVNPGDNLSFRYYSDHASSTNGSLTVRLFNSADVNNKYQRGGVSKTGGQWDTFSEAITDALGAGPFDRISFFPSQGASSPEPIYFDDIQFSVDPQTSPVATSIWYADADGDGLGEASDTKVSCFQPTGYVSSIGYAFQDIDQCRQMVNYFNSPNTVVNYVSNPDASDTENPNVTEIVGSANNAGAYFNLPQTLQVDQVFDWSIRYYVVSNGTINSGSGRIIMRIFNKSVGSSTTKDIILTTSKTGGSWQTLKGTVDTHGSVQAVIDAGGYDAMYILPINTAVTIEPLYVDDFITSVPPVYLADEVADLEVGNEWYFDHSSNEFNVTTVPVGVTVSTNVATPSVMGNSSPNVLKVTRDDLDEFRYLQLDHDNIDVSSGTIKMRVYPECLIGTMPKITLVMRKSISGTANQLTTADVILTANTWNEISVDLTTLVGTPIAGNLYDQTILMFNQGSLIESSYYLDAIQGPPQQSSDATLSDLQVDDTTVEDFSATTLAYDVELPFGTSIVPTVAGTSTHSGATVVVNAAVSLPGTTAVVVTAEDGSEQSYSINFTLTEVATDATLSDLQVEGSTIDSFAAETLSYPVELPFGTMVVPSVTATKNNEFATLVITAASELPGTTTVVVTAQDGSSKTYQVVFTLAAGNSDATLSDLKVDGTLVEGFFPTTLSYDIDLPFGTTIVPTVTATQANESASISINETSVLPGTSTVQVTAGDGSIKTYSVNFVLEAASTDATLSDLQVGGNTVTGFSAETLNYDVELSFGTTAVPTVTATENDDNATLEITAAGTLPGTTIVAVTAQDGSVRRYSVSFTLGAAPSDATLSNLQVDGTTVFGFETETLNYDVVLPLRADVPVVTATANDGAATVLITPASALPGITTVEVTAQDGAKRTYTLSFTLGAVSADFSLSDLTVDGTTVEGFLPTTLSYDVELPIGTTLVPVVAATATNAWATVEVSVAAGLSGTTLVSVTAQNGSIQIYKVNFILKSVLSVGGLGEPNMYVSNGQLIIANMESKASGLVEVISLTGKMLISKKISGSHNEINLNYSGVAIIRYHNALNNSIVSKKVFIRE
ncbi:hypothetical protein N7E81_01845 [Reichenbachiella carrageenanivorans]|uniref:Por secretion system C-terminal sorting domain-containing protein n=1 Tax=Reichenbachiella carrageenanivorans TaxID=2979869 RepID=A0ABY6D101_9BACT|nr:hypothetical protein [Reichenbachiella carrageenanivorans]UXX79847.1 hypothetical protein N7E81_01845 [Reichenbachiella carrageenanivorans]